MKILLSTLILASVFTSWSDIQAQEWNWWRMFHQGQANWGYSSSLAPDTCELTWSFTTGAPFDAAVHSSPAVYNDKLYVGSYNNKIYCLDAMGNGDGTTNVIWSYSVDDIVESSPVVAYGNVYVAVGGFDETLYCLDAEGNGDGTTDLIWSYPGIISFDNNSSPTVRYKKVFIGGRQNFHCLDAMGNGNGTTDHIWSYEVKYSERLSSAAVDCWRVYFGATGSGSAPGVYCLDELGNGDGTTDLIWKSWAKPTMSSPCFIEYYFQPYPRRIFIGCEDGNVYCLDAKGNGNGTTNTIWSYKTGGAVDSSPAMIPWGDYRICVGSDDGKVYCLDAEGNGDGSTDLVWRFQTAGEVHSSPAVADGKIFVGSLDRKVYCLDAEGNGDQTTDELWSYPTDQWIFSSPAIANEKVYVGSHDGKVYAFGFPPGHRHLYYTGSATPGGNIECKLIGPPGSSPVGLFIGSGILPSPLSTMWGNFYLNFPFILIGPLGAIPSNGVMVLPANLPMSPPAPYDVPMQALIGLNADSLTNVSVLEVR